MIDLVEKLRELRGKITPGPWTAGFGDTPFAELPESWCVDAEHTGAICTLDGPSDEREANAEMIALAPDMADALEAQAAKIERLKGLLEEAREAFQDIGNAVPMGPLDSVTTWRNLADARASVARTLLTKLTEESLSGGGGE